MDVAVYDVWEIEYYFFLFCLEEDLQTKHILIDLEYFLFNHHILILVPSLFEYPKLLNISHIPFPLQKSSQANQKHFSIATWMKVFTIFILDESIYYFQQY
jgi:hypothetical protein